MNNLELKQKKFPVSCQCGNYSFDMVGQDLYKCKSCDTIFKIKDVDMEKHNLYKSYEVIKNGRA